MRKLGGFFCAILVLATASCRRDATPDWDTPGTPAGAPAEAATSSAAAPPAATPPTARKAQVSGSGLRFVAYNVENWLTMDRYVDRKMIRGAPKPESEKSAAISLLARHSPDVLGLCEIGTAADLAEIQERLKAAGVVLPHSHYTGGSDPTRHLGLLSRFPITSTTRPTETTYRLAGRSFAINRGILDATVDVRGEPFRFVGVHLKSKRESEQGDQEAIRLAEARLLRQHVDSILKADPNARVVVYGDFNDTRGTRVLKMITGKYAAPNYLTAIPAKDSAATAWTHHWASQDIYSRFDFVMVTRALRKVVDFPASHIIDDADWAAASDHRPVVAIFK